MRAFLALLALLALLCSGCSCGPASAAAGVQARPGVARSSYIQTETPDSGIWPDAEVPDSGAYINSYAWYLDGADEKVQNTTEHNTIFGGSAANETWAIYVKFSTFENTKFYFLPRWGSYVQAYISSAYDSTVIQLGSANTATYNNLFTDNDEALIVVTFDGSLAPDWSCIKLYVGRNGSAPTLRSRSGYAGTCPATISRTTNYFPQVYSSGVTMAVADFGVWEDTLTLAEVESLANTHWSLVGTDLKLYWTFGDKSGDSVASGTQDWGGAGYNGAAINMEAGDQAVTW